MLTIIIFILVWWILGIVGISLCVKYYVEDDSLNAEDILFSFFSGVFSFIVFGGLMWEKKAKNFKIKIPFLKRKNQ